MITLYSKTVVSSAIWSCASSQHTGSRGCWWGVGGTARRAEEVGIGGGGTDRGVVGGFIGSKRRVGDIGDGRGIPGKVKGNRGGIGTSIIDVEVANYGALVWPHGQIAQIQVQSRVCPGSKHRASKESIPLRQ
jgi:hypothetical protein